MKILELVKRRMAPKPPKYPIDSKVWVISASLDPSVKTQRVLAATVIAIEGDNYVFADGESVAYYGTEKDVIALIDTSE